MAWPDRRQLVDIANDQESSLVRYRFHERLHQHDIDHGSLVDHQQVAVEWVVVAALEAAALRVDLQQPVDGLGLEAGRLGHALGGAASRRAQQKVGALGCEDAQNGFDNGGLADTGTAGHDQDFGGQREPDRGYLTFGKAEPDALLDPWQGLVRVDPGPRQPTDCQSRQPLGNNALRAMQTGRKHASGKPRRFVVWGNRPSAPALPVLPCWWQVPARHRQSAGRGAGPESELRRHKRS